MNAINSHEQSLSRQGLLDELQERTMDAAHLVEELECTQNAFEALQREYDQFQNDRRELMGASQVEIS